MKISKKSFILLGIFLWGIPIGIIISIIIACIKPNTIFEIQKFQFLTFFKMAFIIVPFFTITGFFAGLFLSKLSEKYIP